MKLYEIKDNMEETLNIFLEGETGEENQEFYDETMKILEKELKTKSTGIIKYIRGIESDIEAVKGEIDRLNTLKKSRENKVKNLKTYLITTMQSMDKSKIETHLGTYRINKSQVVEIKDLELIPSEYIKEKLTFQPDKVEIKKAIKAGERVEGAVIEERYSILVK